MQPDDVYVHKEPEPKTNRHEYSTRDQNIGPFFKRNIKYAFLAIGPKQGYLGAVWLKER